MTRSREGSNYQSSALSNTNSLAIRLPESICHTNFIPFIVRSYYGKDANTLEKQGERFGWTIAQVKVDARDQQPMPQEISVSYQAIKSKVYRLIDALVVGEKTEADVQESIQRWWDLIHPADRPVAQKYLLLVLGRSASALDAVGDGLFAAGGGQYSHSELDGSHGPSRRMRMLDRIIKETGVRSAV